MPAYAAAIPRPPRTLTELEQATLLKVTGERRDGFRDHVIFAVALGTGLREHEIAALDVGDVLHEDGRVRRRIALRTFKRSSTEPATQEVFIPYDAREKRPGVAREKCPTDVIDCVGALLQQLAYPRRERPSGSDSR